MSDPIYSQHKNSIHDTTLCARVRALSPLAPELDFSCISRTINYRLCERSMRETKKEQKTTKQMSQHKTKNTSEKQN